MWEFSRDAHDLLRLARPWLIRARLLLLRLLRLQLLSQYCLYTVAKLRKLRFPSFTIFVLFTTVLVRFPTSAPSRYRIQQYCTVVNSVCVRRSRSWLKRRQTGPYKDAA